MRQMVHIALFGLAAFAAVPVVGAAPQASLSTTKGVAPFTQCFAAEQDRAGRAWAFVPKEDGGGTFSNVGATGVRQPYFIDVADRGSTREIRVAGADQLLVRAVQHCA